MKVEEVITIQDVARQSLVGAGHPPDTQASMNILLAEQAGLLELSAEAMRLILDESIRLDAKNEAAWNFLIEKMLEVTAGVPVRLADAAEGAVAA